ncbi:MAG: cation-translocating P-type ATPase [Actinomycetes bacterium]
MAPVDLRRAADRADPTSRRNADDAGEGPVQPHHSVEAEHLLAALASHPLRGLSEEEAARRLHRHGRNVLARSTGPGPLRRLLQQFHHPLIYVLLVGGVVMVAIGDVVDASVVFAVVVLNVAVGYVQESKAESALESLRKLAHATARVVRDGQEREIPSEEVVPGDLVLVEAGDKLPADLRLLREVDLRVDESALTGESLPVDKQEGVLPDHTPVADRVNMAWSGTLATAGNGAGVVVATGSATQLGEISRLVDTAEQLATPLTRKLAHFSRLLTVVILALAAVTFGVGLLRGQPAAEMLTAAIALAVAAIPEGLPAAVTVTLAIGVVRMARRQAVIRHLPAVETLGGTTVICSDKTGTLTQNAMTVQEVWTPGGSFTITAGDGPLDGEVLDAVGHSVAPSAVPALHWTLLAGAACNDAKLGSEPAGGIALIGDPTEAALLVAAVKAGIDLVGLDDSLPRVDALPFTSERGRMVTLHRDGDGDVLLVKGGVERVLELCSTQTGPDGEPEPLDAAAAASAAEEMAARGLRVLAVARGRWPGGRLREDRVRRLELSGLTAMLDPPRPAVPAAVAACRRAGIEVKVITGDHAATARAIALRTGLLDPADADCEDRLLTGADLASLPASDHGRAVERARVLARVSPEQKLRLVESLQRRGHVVAMTGDGVNDAPALRAADIGVAMGHGGTDVAKDAADMVLLDDDFATIEAAVEEGRGVFDNLQKFLAFALPTNGGQALVLLVAVLLGLTLPILPVQILWINLTTAVALGLTLAFEPREAGVMARPPRRPDAPLVSSSTVLQMVFVSVVLLGASLWMFQTELAAGATDEQARTAALNLFVAVQVVYLFSCRSLIGPAWRAGLLSNRWLLLGVAVQLAAQAALTWLPAMNAVFDTAPPTATSWVKLLAYTVAAAAVIGWAKKLRLRLLGP